MEKLVSDHVTPKCSDAEWEKRKRACVMSLYGHVVRRCGYCGGAHHMDYVCHCGFQEQYNDDMQLIWSDK